MWSQQAILFGVVASLAGLFGDVSCRLSAERESFAYGLATMISWGVVCPYCWYLFDQTNTSQTQLYGRINNA